MHHKDIQSQSEMATAESHVKPTEPASKKENKKLNGLQKNNKKGDEEEGGDGQNE